MPRVPVNLQATNAANTARAGVILGTPVTTAYAANTLVISNTFASGDIAIVANRGGNSEEYLWCDSSAGQLKITSPAAHLLINTVSDTTSVRINVRNFTQATGTSIGMRVAPNQTITTTGGVTGAEISPRYNDAGGGDLICLKVDPVVKDATTARTIANVRGIEINVDLPNAGSAYTFTNGPTGIRIFPDFGSGHTFSGRRVILLLAAPNTSDWQYLLEAETGTNGWVVSTAGTYSTADGYFLIRVGASDYRVPFFAGTD